MARKALAQNVIEIRESAILRIAEKLFLAEGIEGLTMERLASRTEYSKGTLYNHFSSKEDVLAALCQEICKLRYDLLERAALFRGRARERLLAASKADYIIYKLYPDAWRVEQIVDVLSLTSKVSPERRAALDAVVDRSIGMALGIVRDGISSGDLVVPKGLTPEKLLMGLYGLTRGLYLLDSHGNPVVKWASDLFSAHEQIIACACDGFGWKPFSADWDYAESVRRIWKEVFPKEGAKLHLLQPSELNPT